jgi:hypothetical protein
VAKPKTADDILTLVDDLPPQERVRLLRLMTSRSGESAAAAYSTVPPGPQEFSTDEDPLSWDAEGWEDFE